MPNTILTPDMITREALRILHQKCNFIGSINRQYDDSFANEGAKIGSSLRIRLPNEYTVRSTMTRSNQDTVEQSVTLPVTSVKGVDVNFTSEDLTLSLDDFSERIISPAMSVLAANVEADAISMYKDVYNIVDQDAAAFSFSTITAGRERLTNMLAPPDMRNLNLTPEHTTKYLNDTKGLQNDSQSISKQYREGQIGGPLSGFKSIYENTLLGIHQTGTAAKTTGYTVNGAITTNGSSSVVVAAGSTTFLKGDVFTVAGCFRVHPETKVSTGQLQQFVVTADYAGGAGTISFAPAIYTTTGRQNVTAGGMPTGNALVKVAAGASETINNSLAYHKDAFTFATADLVLPKGVDMASRQVMDGISMSMVRDFDINDRTFPVRFDVLYGFKAIRPQLAARLHADG